MPTDTTAAPLDVLIVGAGISGIGAACYLQRSLPGKRWAIVEARDQLGGTWSLFQYPGIRSDSDLYTFGYEFKPWKSEKSIAEASVILDYLQEAADENGVTPHIRFQHEIKELDWDSSTGLWTATIWRSDTQSEITLQARWIFGATGYYNYDQGYRPQFPGEDQFPGPILHPQHWPEDFDATGKNIAVIGSGATAVTLVPALAKTAAHVTQVQRTPTYVLPAPSEDGLANWMRRWLPEGFAYRMSRSKNILQQRVIWAVSRRFPKLMRRFIRWANVKSLPEGYPVDEHFSPPYNPWDQRLCVAPDGDFFDAIKSGKASVSTGEMESFTPTGIKMKSGQEIAADAIVTATGLTLKVIGGIEIKRDGVPITFSDHIVFKGMMLDGVPNFAFAVGYTNASWTLKIGLLCEHFCRLLAHMDEHGHTVCVATRPSGSIETRPLLDFGAGYIQRSLDTLPRQGADFPWETSFSYAADAKIFKRGAVDDPALQFSSAQAPAE